MSAVMPRVLLACAQSRHRCGWGEPSPGADVGGVQCIGQPPSTDRRTGRCVRRLPSGRWHRSRIAFIAAICTVSSSPSSCTAASCRGAGGAEQTELLNGSVASAAVEPFELFGTDTGTAALTRTGRRDFESREAGCMRTAQVFGTAAVPSRQMSRHAYAPCARRVVRLKGCTRKSKKRRRPISA